MNQTSQIVAIKKIIINAEDRVDGIPISALREISILRSLKHPNIINAMDVVVGEEWEDVYMVMEYVEQVGNLDNAARSGALAAGGGIGCGKVD